MAGLPVVCERCGLVFEQPDFVVGGPGLTIEADEGARIGPHPGCGGYGRVAAGTYRWIADGLHVALRSGLAPADLRAIVTQLQRAHGAVTVEGLQAELRDAPPWVAEILDRLDANADLETRRYWIQVIIGILGILMSLASAREGDPNPVAPPVSPAPVEADQETTNIPSEDEIERLAVAIADDVAKRIGSQSSSQDAPAMHPMGSHMKRPAAAPRRNQPCWCDSGKKFKYCHGR